MENNVKEKKRQPTNMANTTDAALEALLLKMQTDTCYPYTEGISSAYKYFPSLAAGIVFCILFGIPFLYHTFQSVRLRAATSILLAFGALSTSTSMITHAPVNNKSQKNNLMSLLIIRTKTNIVLFFPQPSW